MSMIEGGEFICYRHEFSTEDIEEWNNHCIKNGHTISGVAPCVNCGVAVQFYKIPFIKIGQNPPLQIHIKCEVCP